MKIYEYEAEGGRSVTGTPIGLANYFELNKQRTGWYDRGLIRWEFLARLEAITGKGLNTC